MPKTIKNRVQTEFRADDKMTRGLGVMSRGMQRLNRVAGRVKRGLKMAGRAVLFLGKQAARFARVGLFAMAGAATAVFLSVTKLAGGMDELAKTTRAIDFDIEKFQEFKFAAEQTGVAGEKFGTIVKKFSATVGEFKGGYGTLFTALKKINPQLGKQLRQTGDTSEAFELYLKAIREAPTALDKTALASAAFGKRMGIDMINMANLSAEELGKLRAQMRANGVVTLDQAKKAEAFNDAMNRLKLTAKGLAIDALGPLMPMFEKGADRIRSWIIENKALIAQKVHKVFDRIVEFGKRAFKFLKENIPPLIATLRNLGSDGFKWIKENKKELKEFGNLLLWIGNTFINIAKFVIKHKEAVIAAVVAYKALGLSMSALNFAQMTAGMASAGGAISGLSTKAGSLAGVLGKGGLLFGSFAAGWAVGSAIFKEWNESASNLALNAENMAARVSMSFRKMNMDTLESTDKMLQQQEKSLDSFWNRTKALLSGNIQAHNDAVKAVKDARLKGLQEQKNRLLQSSPKEALPQRVQGARTDFSNVAIQMNPFLSQKLEAEPHLGNAQQAAPQAQVSRTENIRKEITEIVIRDESGRAEVTKGKGAKGLTLAHTGAM